MRTWRARPRPSIFPGMTRSLNTTLIPSCSHFIERRFGICYVLDPVTQFFQKQCAGGCHIRIVFHQKGLGLSLVEGFAQQIQGRVEYVPVETGSKTTFCFPRLLRHRLSERTEVRPDSVFHGMEVVLIPLPEVTHSGPGV